MSATATRPAARSRPHGPKLTAIVAATAVAALALAQVMGATGLFDALVFVVFAVLWLCFAAALAFAPAQLDELWLAFRGRSLVLQAVGWLLFLPLTAALLVWERRWHVAARLGLLLTIAAVNLLAFFPRGWS